MLTGILSFLGVIIGASLQYFFTRHIDNQRHHRDLRSKAYMDYLKCVCDQALLRPARGSKEQKEIFARTGDAKARICLYGSSKVISAFSQFEILGATMNTQKQRDAFTDMVAAMRFEAGAKSIPSGQDMQNILLGFRPDES